MNITHRTAHDCQQGSEAWHTLRAGRFTASEAPAMLGVSKYQARADLLKRKATGLVEEVDAATKRRFDEGHAAEAAARPIVEDLVGEELWPVTMTAEVDGLPLLASMDGLTMLGDTGWETKLLNQDLRAAVEAGELPEHYTAQMEQQMLVAGCERIYFTTSDGTPENTFGLWYESNPDLRARIVAGWKQFAEDLAAYVPEPEIVKPAGKAPEALPALRIEVTGMVTASNLAAFREHALAVFGGIKTDLQSDADFADAERTVKWCKEVEDKLDAAKQHALSQTASIDELFRTIDAIKEEARQKRLTLDRLVKAEKENRKGEIVASAGKAYRDHWTALCRRIGGDWIPAIGVGYWADAIK
ncbi:lambda-exonuclease family protein [Thauera aromatica]|uniref:lambda-exonuclease family protein n=1 Tax=Thauera aromatica TaxID=59405 RepID=UPI001FFCCEE0|nr:YqaJ viral recombinase family protein [Thauera aromatica]MCK2097715.1 YqaJ viral recombinase family protein [Thauera aromatica]